MPTFDVFISYAHEDSEVALTIARGLENKGLNIWIDKKNLMLGDSLIDEIGKAITRSRFGLLVLSKSYLKKQWTITEFKALFHLQLASGQKVILPIWYNITANDIIPKFPFLADIKALIYPNMEMEDIVDTVFNIVKDYVDEPINKMQLFIEDKKNKMTYNMPRIHSRIFRKSLKLTLNKILMQSTLKPTLKR